MSASTRRTIALCWCPRACAAAFLAASSKCVPSLATHAGAGALPAVSTRLSTKRRSAAVSAGPPGAVSPMRASTPMRSHTGL